MKDNNRFDCNPYGTQSSSNQNTAVVVMLSIVCAILGLLLVLIILVTFRVLYGEEKSSAAGVSGQDKIITREDDREPGDRAKEEWEEDPELEDRESADREQKSPDEPVSPEESEDAAADKKDDNDFQMVYSHDSYDVTASNWEEEGQDESYSYYSGPYNTLRDDLSYEVSFTQEYFYSDEYANVGILIEYPQISDPVKSADYINAALYGEYEYYYELYKQEFEPRIQSQYDCFFCSVDSYVTYMDETMFSVVFKESLSYGIDGESYSTLTFFCLNFDLEAGTVLTNTEVLRLDEAFAADFRVREREENGEGALTDFTDEELLQMLKDPDKLVLFYTPMGLEAGLNLEESVVYVTYADYEDYLNRF